MTGTGLREHMYMHGWYENVCEFMYECEYESVYMRVILWMGVCAKMYGCVWKCVGKRMYISICECMYLWWEWGAAGSFFGSIPRERNFL